MSGNRTFALLKPDAIENHHLGEILCIITKAGFRIKAMKLTRMSLPQVKRFYTVHEGKEFFERLTSYMSSGPLVALVLEKDNAVEAFRQILGSTDPDKAAEGTIRRKFGLDVTRNSVHGSDSDENAQIEGSFFFATREVEP